MNWGRRWGVMKEKVPAVVLRRLQQLSWLGKARCSSEKQTKLSLSVSAAQHGKVGFRLGLGGLTWEHEIVVATDSLFLFFREDNLKNLFRVFRIVKFLVVSCVLN